MARSTGLVLITAWKLALCFSILGLSALVAVEEPLEIDEEQILIGWAPGIMNNSMVSLKVSVLQIRIGDCPHLHPDTELLVEVDIETAEQQSKYWTTADGVCGSEMNLSTVHGGKLSCSIRISTRLGELMGASHLSIWRTGLVDHPSPRCLLSFPRSGNHWIRFLIELLTHQPTMVSSAVCLLLCFAFLGADI